jgi:4-hydroxybenzoate polyprenyltransferase
MDMKQVDMPTSLGAFGTTGAQSLGTPVALRAWLRELRTHQWLKNLLVFVPLLTSHEFGLLAKVLAACVAFVAFSCTASATYIFNDILDIRNDRAHPRKYARPIAANIISVRAGALATVLLAGAGLTLSIALPRAYLFVLVAYALVAVAYSLRLKRLLLVDILALAVLYALRIVAGAYAIDVVISSWLIVFSIFIFFSLALVKRCAELVALERSGAVGRAPGRNYRTSDLNVLWPLGVGSSLCAIVVFGLFVFSVQAEGQYTSPSVLWLCGVALLYWTARLWVKTSRGEMHDDPLVFAMRDQGSRTAILIMTILVIAAYLGPPLP